MLNNSSCRLLLLPGVVAIASALLLPVGAQEADSRLREHFLAAQQAQQEGLLDDAAREYQAVLRLKPDLPEAYLNLGLVDYAQAKFDKSARALTAAGKLRPGMRGVSLWLGIDYVKLYQPARAVAILREAVQSDPADKLAQTWLGTALWESGSMDAALLQLRTAAARFPDDPDLLFALGEAYGKAASQQTEELLEETSGTALSDLIYGTIYAEDREWTKAEGHLRRAIERDPHSLDAHTALAEVFIEQARLPDAMQQLEQASALSPHSAAAMARAGELLLTMGKTEEGLSRLEKAIEIDRSEALDALGLPVEDRIDQSESADEFTILCRETAAKLEADSTPSPAREVALASLYTRAGDQDAALRAYSRIVFAPAISIPSASAFVQALEAMHWHRYEVAEAALLSWLAANPDDLTARYELALARRRISMNQVLRLLAIAPDSYHVHQLLGQMYVSREEDDKALIEYLAVAAARPDLPGIHFWLGHLYWKHGDADRARAELTRELQLDPGHPEANGELGAVLVSEERAKEAIPHLELAIHAKPDLWPAYPQLGRAYSIEKNFPRAEQVLEQGLAHDKDGATHYQLGLVFRAEGKTAQAAHFLAQVRAIKNEALAGSSPTLEVMGAQK